MKPVIGFCLLVIFTTTGTLVLGAKKGKKERKSALQWKSSSMPAMNKRVESVFEGNDLMFDCKAQGHPKPSVKWLKDGVELKNSNSVEVKKFTLALKSLTKEMSGNYSCVVSNKNGHIDWTFHLDVQVKIWPLIIEGPNSITQTVGSNVAFRCKVLNDPNATIRWQKIRSVMSIDDSVPHPDFLPDGDDPQILMIDNIQKEDEGEYRCMAGNVWGLKFANATLTVIEPVLVADLPRPTPTDNNNNNNNRYYNNINDNNEIDPEPPIKSDHDDTRDVNEGESFYEGGNSFTGLEPPEYDPDQVYATTKRPKNSSNRRKNGRKKDKKGKDKNLIMEEDSANHVPATTVMSQTVSSMDNVFQTTFPEIWHFETNGDANEMGDSRYTPAKGNKDETLEETDAEEANSTEQKAVKGSISSWAIYTIVGAVGGVILLIGLVAITLTLCCKREVMIMYKSTSV